MSDTIPRNSLIKPNEEQNANGGGLPETKLDDPKLQPRSNAYEVGLI